MNERLEFLGNSVPDYITTMHLYHKYPGISRGLLTDLRSASVNNDFYSLCAIRAGLQKHILHASQKLHRQLESSLQKLDPLLMEQYLDGSQKILFPSVLSFLEILYRIISQPCICTINTQEYHAIGVLCSEIRSIINGTIFGWESENSLPKHLEFLGNSVLDYITTMHLAGLQKHILHASKKLHRQLESSVQNLDPLLMEQNLDGSQKILCPRNRLWHSDLKRRLRLLNHGGISRQRPSKVCDIVGNEDAVSRLQVIARDGNMPDLILAGFPGTGEAASILAFAHELLGPNCKEGVLELNASDDRSLYFLGGTRLSSWPKLTDGMFLLVLLVRILKGTFRYDLALL
ncbi:hypothetical protein ACET3Z_006129 [Daucus carota]